MSSKSADDLKHLLLDMISTTSLPTSKQIAELDDDDWQALRTIASQHRIGPMLHHQYKVHINDWAVPDDIAQTWSGAYQKSAMRSLRMRQALRGLDTILNAGVIPYAAMKGAWLFLYAYADPALRPMRDIDIIVAPNSAFKAFELLEANGFVRSDEYAKPAEYALEHKKHLPPLRCSKTGILVEVHARLIDHIADAERSGPLGDAAALLQRAERRNGVAFLSPTDTMLHLVVHAVYDHQFNNGPLTLNDIALLARSSEIDWDRFWTMADSGNWTRGAELLFAMVRRYHDRALLPDRSDARIPPEQIDAALLLMLQDFDQRWVVAVHGELEAAQSPLKRLAALWKRALPGRHVIAEYAGASSKSWWTLAYYPKWLAIRLGRMIFDRQVDDVKLDIRRAAQVESWLQANEKSS